MSGIYGDMLLVWAEQHRTVTVFDMKPKINSGWDKVVDQQGQLITQTVRGVYQNTKGDQIKDSNGNLVKTKGFEFWTKEKDLDGKFLTHTDGCVYRLTSSNDWSFEGGFYRYSLDKVVGNDATESDNATWNLGTNTFS